MTGPAGSRSRAEEICDVLSAEILSGRHVGGARLGLRTELIEQFQVSPGVINEALRLLRARGLVSVKPGPNGGVFAAELPPGVRLGALDLWFQGLPAPPLEVFESRSLLEDLFCGLAVDRATDEDVARMRGGLVEMERVAEDPRAFFEANVHFHQVIARAAGAPLLVAFYDALVTVILGGLARIAYSGDYKPMISHNLRVHGQLVEAIAARDRSRLATAIALHHKDMTSMEEPELSPRADTVVPVDTVKPRTRPSRTAASEEVS